MTSQRLKIRLRSLAYRGYKHAKHNSPFWTMADAWQFLAATVEPENKTENH